MSRTPFPIPLGWFQIGWPTDLEPGGVKPLYYFGRDLVLWRDTDQGEFHLQDAICPHLGAHLGHGGHVEHCELMCPFHGWKFDAEGKNSDIPYSDRVNRSAKIRTYPLIQRNGLLMAWYHPFDEPPTYEIPEVAEFNSPQGWSELVGRSFIIPSPWQDIAENSVDSAHFRYVHNTDAVPEVEVYETDGARYTMRSVQKFVTPQGVVDGRIDVDGYGPGFSVTRFSGFADLALMGCSVPISASECQLRFSFTTRSLGDDAFTSAVGDAFIAEVSQQVVEDIPIWKHKAHIPRPALADTDGPYLKFRKWASQFYAEEVVIDQAMYPPNPPSSPEPKAEGMSKNTASSRIKGEDTIKSDMMS